MSKIRPSSDSCHPDLFRLAYFRSSQNVAVVRMAVDFGPGRTE
jgi:hypothetical protein